MAEIKFIPRLDMAQLKKDLSDLFQKKFKVGVGTDSSGGKTSTAAKNTKKTNSLLGGIIGKLAPLAILASLKPIADVLGLLLNFASLGVLLIFKYLKKFEDLKNGLALWIWEKLKQGFIWLMEKLGEGWKWLTDIIAEWWGKAIEWIKALPGKIWEWLKALPGLIWEWLKAGFEWLVNTLKQGWEWLTSKLGELKDKFVEKVIELKEKLVSKFIELRDKFKENLEKVKNKLSNWLMVAVEWLKALPGKIWDKTKQLAGLIWDKIKQGFNSIVNAISKLNPFKSKGSSSGKFRDSSNVEKGSDGIYRRINDAIITKTGNIIHTNPNDTLIATQNPSSLGGGTNNFNFYGVTMQEAIDKVKQTIESDRIKSTRF